MVAKGVMADLKFVSLFCPMLINISVLCLFFVCFFRSFHFFFLEVYLNVATTASKKCEEGPVCPSVIYL